MPVRVRRQRVRCLFSETEKRWVGGGEGEKEECVQEYKLNLQIQEKQYPDKTHLFTFPEQ